MLPYEMIAGGTFNLSVSGGVASNVQVQCQSQNPPDFILARAITAWGRLNSENAVEIFWERSMAQATAKLIRQSSSGTVPNMTTVDLTSGGVTTYNTANPPTFASLVGSTVDKTAFTVLMASTANIFVGDTVRLTNVVGMQQISGYTFQVTAVSTNTSITLGYMATAISAGASIASNGTSCSVQKIIPQQFYPRLRRIVYITQAAAGSAKVYFTQPNDFTPGEKIGLRVPSSQWGMIQANNLEARVLSVTNTASESSVTIDIDTSGFSAFTIPTSAQALAGISPAVAVPSTSSVVPANGSLTVPQQPPGTNLLDAFDNRNTRIIQFGAGIFNYTASGITFAPVNNDAWIWQAYKYSQYNGQ